MQIGCEEAVLAGLLVPPTTSPLRPAVSPGVVERTVVSISAYLTFLLLNQGLVASTRYSLPLCHPALRCVVLSEKTLRSLGSLCR